MFFEHEREMVLKFLLERVIEVKLLDKLKRVSKYERGKDGQELLKHEHLSN